MSTVTQAEDGLGLDIQRASIEGWSERSGYAVARWAVDEGLSGTLGVDERPGLAEALGAVETGEVAGLVVAKLDRLARLLTVQEATLAMVWRCGGRVFAADTGEVLADDPEDPMRTAMRQVMGTFAQLERATIAARMRAGRRLKASRGGFVGGAVPLGYAERAGVLVPLADEQATVARILELRAAGHSLRSMAAVLEAEGYRPKQAGRWHHSSLSKVLRRHLAT